MTIKLEDNLNQAKMRTMRFKVKKTESKIAIDKIFLSLLQ